MVRKEQAGPNGQTSTSFGSLSAHSNFVNPNLTDLPPLYRHCIDDHRPVKVICIGAGFSGVLAAIRFPQRIPNLTFIMYEKNEELGGTWWENKYVY